MLPSGNNRAYGHRDVISVHHDDSSVPETCPGLNRRPDRGNRRNSGGTNELYVEDPIPMASVEPWITRDELKVSYWLLAI